MPLSQKPNVLSLGQGRETTMTHERKPLARSIHFARKIHRTMGIFLFAAFIVIGATGLLLGWDKRSFGLIHPKTYSGVSTDMADWLPIESLHEKALAIAREQISPDAPLKVSRIEFRPANGMVKIRFSEGYTGLQLDCTTGELLHVERRRHDFIMSIHDGSILDNLLGTSGEPIKVTYTTVAGTALLLFSITGFWLWMGPRRLRSQRLAQGDVGAQ